MSRDRFSHFSGCGFASGFRCECVTAALTPKKSGPDLLQINSALAHRRTNMKTITQRTGILALWLTFQLAPAAEPQPSSGSSASAVGPPARRNNINAPPLDASKAKEKDPAPHKSVALPKPI